MSYLRKAYRWSPKNIGLLASPAFVFLLIMNKSEWKIRFLDWGFGLLVAALMVLFFILRGRIHKKELAVFILPLLWVFCAFIMTPFAFDVNHHLKELLKVAVLILLSSFLIVALFSREKLASKTIILTSTLWVLINSALLLFWYFGILEYEKADFSGLFQNRNEFAVQTVILMAMCLFFVKGHSFVKAFFVILSFLLVASTLSMKGFVLFFFVVFFSILLRSRLRKKVFYASLFALLFACSYLAMPNIQDRMSRFSTALTNPDELRQNESAFLRVWLTVEGSKLVVQNPITGVGVHNARFFLIPPLAQERGDEVGVYSHNNYVEMALNAGVLGLLLFYLPLVYIYFKVNVNHPHWLAIKTFSVLYLLAGIAMVQYNNFISIFLYSLIVFMYFYYEEKASFDQDSLHCQYA